MSKILPLPLIKDKDMNRLLAVIATSNKEIQFFSYTLTPLYPHISITIVKFSNELDLCLIFL